MFSFVLFSPVMDHFPYFSRRKLLIIVATSVVLGGILAILNPPKLPPNSSVPALIAISQPFNYTFNTDGVLKEAASSQESTSPYWWLNSGAKLQFKDGVGKTIQGDLPALDPWRILYAANNPTDTDNGKHPQNIFRLVTKSSANNMRVESLFKIEEDNWSNSPNRNASNGLLLMTRYIDGDNLYYVGIRVDGTAVIKKKYKGTYYTMASKKGVFSGTYTRESNINLLPHHEWIGLRAENMVRADGTVTVRLFMKRGNESTWSSILEANDDGKSYGGAAITKAGRSGIRTDFMDVSFESFKMEAL